MFVMSVWCVCVCVVCEGVWCVCGVCVYVMSVCGECVVCVCGMWCGDEV